MIEEQRAMTMEEAVFLLKEHMETIPQYSVYYSLRQWKCKPITDTITKVVRACIAIDDLKLPITAELINILLGRNMESRAKQNYTTMILHNIGDKGIILLSSERASRGRFMWIMNHNFRNLVKW